MTALGLDLHTGTRPQNCKHRRQVYRSGRVTVAIPTRRAETQIAVDVCSVALHTARPQSDRAQQHNVTKFEHGAARLVPSLTVAADLKSQTPLGTASSLARENFWPKKSQPKKSGNNCVEICKLSPSRLYIYLLPRGVGRAPWSLLFPLQIKRTPGP